jgi:hypothetical protein
MLKTKGDVAIETFRTLCSNVGTEYSHRALRLVEQADFLALSALKFNPGEYHNVRDFELDYMIYSYLRKYRGFPMSKETLVLKALTTFHAVEERNRETNLRLQKRTYLLDDMRRIFHAAREKMYSILGPLDLDSVFSRCEWGPGATESIKAQYAYLDMKMHERRISVTSCAKKYADAYFLYDWQWMAARLGPDCVGPSCPLPCQYRIVDSSRWTTVEKTVSARRSIDIQPTLNLFFQKGVGSFMRKKLKTFGVDLDNQGLNQMLASLAQKFGFATLDLSNASDTVSRQVVKALLPPEWYDLLCDLRTEFTILPDGKKVRLEKFSSMGNGFTFELESAIFFCILTGVKEVFGNDDDIISVYGDDLIVPERYAPECISALGYFGFEVNVDKTFISGRFFESCGKHYYDGYEVTPIYQKEQIVDEASLYRAANRLFIKARRLGGDCFVDGIIRRAWDDLVALSELRLFGPHWVEGDGFIKDASYVAKTDINGVFSFKEIRSRPIKVRADDPALLATTYRRGVVTMSPFKGFLDFRGKTSTHVKKRRETVSMRPRTLPMWWSPTT